MEIFLITFGAMLLMVAAMAVGVIFSNKEIKGSCGGMKNIEGLQCGLCEKPCEKRLKAMARMEQEQAEQGN